MSRSPPARATDNRPAPTHGGALTAEPDRANEPGQPDQAADRPGIRGRVRAHWALGPAYRAAVGVIGIAVVILGLILLPLPGPGWLVVFIGLGILATEFVWAERLLGYARRQVRRWTDWVRRQTVTTRVLLGAGTAVLVAAAATGYLAWQGVPFVAD